MMKGLTGYWNVPKGKKNHADYPLIRYADVLLGYAEAQNEAVGPDASVLEAINQIRTRKDVAIPDNSGKLWRCQPGTNARDHSHGKKN
ncbi:MAG: RagB/SusD family nutrient uptake outer membrane protein [Mangrovibacterium sp.]